MLKILCKLIIIWVNCEKKTISGPFLWNNVYNECKSNANEVRVQQQISTKTQHQTSVYDAY